MGKVNCIVIRFFFIKNQVFEIFQITLVKSSELLGDQIVGGSIPDNRFTFSV